MKGLLIPAAFLAAGLLAQARTADVPAAHTPQTPEGKRAAGLSARAEQAFAAYVAAWSSGEAGALSDVVTEDAVIEYALPRPGSFLTVDVDTASAVCATETAALEPRQLANLWIFPAPDEKTVFIHYDTAGASTRAASAAEQQLLMLEMRGKRIARIRNLTMSCGVDALEGVAPN